MPDQIVFAEDETLETWVKQKEPMIAVPPADMKLVGWRDPYIFETLNEQDEREWGMLLGSGIKGRGGSVMIYRSKSLRTGESIINLPYIDLKYFQIVQFLLISFAHKEHC